MRITHLAQVAQSHNIQALAGLICLCCGLLLSNAAMATVYKCVDRSGHTKYSQTPIPNCGSSQRTVAIRPAPAAPAPVATQSSARTASASKTVPAGPTPAQLAQADMQRRQANAASCQHNQAIRAELASGRRLRQQTEQGDYLPVTEDMRAQRLAQIDAYTKANCP